MCIRDSLYTFDGAPLRRLAAMTVRHKKKEKSSEVKYKGPSVQGRYVALIIIHTGRKI